MKMAVKGMGGEGGGYGMVSYFLNNFEIVKRGGLK